ncbi:group II intron reverse transcriptase/maturase [Photobacterium carnosum]|nr:group II intron reverse transcriptase/maturase [Photobacterium carnosum]
MKQANKTSNIAAEPMEGRALTKGNEHQSNHDQTLSWSTMTSKLMLIRKHAIRNKNEKFNNLHHLLTVELLTESFYALKRTSASGIDGVTWDKFQLFQKQLIKQLHEDVQSGRYKPLPARRVHIPKADGNLRPLSIICLKDKIVQQAVCKILESIYEPSFMGFSYGFRPERNQHQALDALYVALNRKKVNWVLDLDITKFFDTVEHQWLIKFLEHRITDKQMLKLIIKWLKVGFLNEEGQRVRSQIGTPQGAVISPLLANIYLHYSFDLWVNQQRNRVATGDVTVVRFADDAVLGFQHRSDAEACLTGMICRLEKFGLTIHPEKTKLIRFGRFAFKDYQQGKSSRPKTFDFLGFTHYWDLTRNRNSIILKRKTIKKRLLSKLKWVRAELRKRLHDKPYNVGRWLKRIIQGHLNYYGVPMNSKSLNTFVKEITNAWLKQLRRRSQRHAMTWQKFRRLIDYWIPKVQITHPYPEKRFDVRPKVGAVCVSSARTDLCGG